MNLILLQQLKQNQEFLPYDASHNDGEVQIGSELFRLLMAQEQELAENVFLKQHLFEYVYDILRLLLHQYTVIHLLLK